MRGAIGLILYLAAMLLSSIVKRIADEKAKQRRRMQTPTDIDPYTVELEDMLAEELEETETEQSADDVETWEEYRDDGDLVDELGDSNESIALERYPRHSWAQAVVMAEILREPRALRRWPSR